MVKFSISQRWAFVNRGHVSLSTFQEAYKLTILLIWSQFSMSDYNLFIYSKSPFSVCISVKRSLCEDSNFWICVDIFWSSVMKELFSEKILFSSLSLSFFLLFKYFYTFLVLFCIIFVSFYSLSTFLFIFPLTTMIFERDMFFICCGLYLLRELAKLK